MDRIVRFYGENARYIRGLRRLSQKYVALESNIPQSTLCKFEQGLADLHLTSAVRLARVLGCTLDILVNGELTRLRPAHVPVAPGEDHPAAEDQVGDRPSPTREEG